MYLFYIYEVIVQHKALFSSRFGHQYRRWRFYVCITSVAFTAKMAFKCTRVHNCPIS